MRCPTLNVVSSTRRCALRFSMMTPSCITSVVILDTSLPSNVTFPIIVERHTDPFGNITLAVPISFLLYYCLLISSDWTSVISTPFCILIGLDGSASPMVMRQQRISIAAIPINVSV